MRWMKINVITKGSVNIKELIACNADAIVLFKAKWQLTWKAFWLSRTANIAQFFFRQTLSSVAFILLIKIVLKKKHLSFFLGTLHEFHLEWKHFFFFLTKRIILSIENGKKMEQCAALESINFQRKYYFSSDKLYCVVLSFSMRMMFFCSRKFPRKKRLIFSLSLGSCSFQQN